MEPLILIHGGAGDIPDSAVPGKLAGLADSVAVGSKVLLDGKSALDAVIAAVKVMENNPFFNCGKGSVLTLHGEVEMDAIVMEGNTLKTGAVTGVTCFEHPVELARLVLQDTPHVLLAGVGAESFAQKQGVPKIPAYRLVTQSAIDALKLFLKNKKEGVTEVCCGDVGTVGAVAIDSVGNLAMATSTGGVTGKYPGRVGDTPLAGCGGYADNATGAVSATGHGEGIIRVGLSHRILTNMDKGFNAQDATKEALVYMQSKVGSTGGAVTVSPKGDIGIYFTSQRMPWAFKRGENEFQSGIDFHPIETADK